MTKRKTPSPQKRQRTSGEKRSRRSNSFLSPLFQRILYVAGAGLLYYLVRTLLQFKPANAESLTPVMILACAGLAWWGTSQFFLRHVKLISLVAGILVVMYLVTNTALSLEWMASQSPWNYISFCLAVPLAVVWMSILKTAGPSLLPDLQETDYSFRKMFRKPKVLVPAIAVFLVCAVMIFYRLGYYDIWEDENLVINASVGISEQGFSYLKEGYDRAWLHSGLNALVFKLFGVSEFTGRLVSAVFGLVFVIGCMYVFARWIGIASLAILVPLVCLLNDQFLILFRYMRMYALWIPLFLLASYFLHRLILDLPGIFPKDGKPNLRKIIFYGLGAVVSLLVLFHLQKLSAILIAGFFVMLLFRAIAYPSPWTNRLLIFSACAALLVAFGAFVLQLDSLNLFRQAVQKASVEGKNYPIYFTYLFRNGLPANCTFMILAAGLGLLVSDVSTRVKSILIFNFIMIGFALYIMAFVLNWSGRDYRYIAHLVPLVVGTMLWILYLMGKCIRPSFTFFALGLPLVFCVLHFIQDADRIYVKHPWAPRYSVVYKAFQERFKPGDALFYPNIKTYYLNPTKLKGAHLFQTPKEKKYSMEQFQADLKEAGHGYIMWEWHKSHHWREDIVRYIYKYFEPIHNKRKDDLGVELFYFDETMIPESN